MKATYRCVGLLWRRGAGDELPTSERVQMAELLKKELSGGDGDRAGEIVNQS